MRLISCLEFRVNAKLYQVKSIGKRLVAGKSMHSCFIRILFADERKIPLSYPLPRYLKDTTDKVCPLLTNVGSPSNNPFSF